jgi:long-chain fatty acid transport protein
MVTDRDPWMKKAGRFLRRSPTPQLGTWKRMVFWGVVVMPVWVHGLGIRVADQDPAATARGNAFVATADTPGAIYYNPAGITQLRGHNVQAGFYGVYLESEYTSPFGEESTTQNDFEVLPQFYYTFMPQKLPVAFGLGFYSPYGLEMDWPDDTGFRTLATEGRVTYFTLNPVVAWQIVPALSVAAGPTFNYGETDLRRGLAVPGDEFKFEGDDTSVGFNLGLWWHPHRQHAFGISYRSATRMDFSGHSSIRSYVPMIPSGSQAAHASMPFPQHIVVGWSFRPTPRWNLEFNIDWTDWEQLDEVTLNQASGDVALPFHWSSSFFYEWGVTYYFNHGLHASLGYIFSENSVPESVFNPLVPDSDRHIFSAGIGQKRNRWRWDLAYQYAIGPSREVNESQISSALGESADGRYQFNSHACTLSIGYEF